VCSQIGMLVRRTDQNFKRVNDFEMELPSRGEENTIFISKKKNITVGQSQPNYVYTYIYMYKDNGSMNASINNNSGQYCPQTIYHGN
jgi:hypothetical protein